MITLTKPSSAILGALSLSNFSIASPKALTEFGADEGTVDEEGIYQPTGTFGTEHPIGTGPFKFDSWERGTRLTMVRNDDYWGEPAKLDSLVFTPIPDNAARLQALQSGDIQGYDLVEPQDIPTIEGDSNLQILDRPPSTSATSASTRRSRRWTTSRSGRRSRTASTGRASSTPSTAAAARWRRSSCRPP